MERSLWEVSPANPPLGAPESSGVRPRSPEREASDRIAEALLTPSETLRGQLFDTLIRDAGLEVIPVYDAACAVRIPYPDALKEALISVYQAWLAPSRRKFSEAIEDRLRVSPLRLQDREALWARVEGAIKEVLSRPRRRAPQEDPSGDRWDGSGEHVTDPFALLRSQVEAFRAILAHDDDWLVRVDGLARGFMDQMGTEEAWAQATHDRKWLPALNAALGFAGLAPDAMRPDARAKRHLAIEEGAFVPEKTGGLSMRVVERNQDAHALGRDAKAEFLDAAHRHAEVVRTLGVLRQTLKRYVRNLEGGQDAFDLPDIFAWRQAVQGFAERINDIEQRRGALEKMLHHAPEREPIETQQRMSEAHFALGEEKVAHLIRLKKVREAYQLIGRQLETLAEQGIVLTADKPIGLQGLLDRVEDRLRQMVVALPQTASTQERTV